MALPSKVGPCFWSQIRSCFTKLASLLKLLADQLIGTGFWQGLENNLQLCLPTTIVTQPYYCDLDCICWYCYYYCYLFIIYYYYYIIYYCLLLLFIIIIVLLILLVFVVYCYCCVIYYWLLWERPAGDHMLGQMIILLYYIWKVMGWYVWW